MSRVLLLATILTSLTIVEQARVCENKKTLQPGASVAQKFMNCWGKDVEHGQSDLVILLDGSGSMYPSGFKQAKDFIDALLTEVRVAFNATRISIVTFSTQVDVNINYLWNPTSANHKCK